MKLRTWLYCFLAASSVAMTAVISYGHPGSPMTAGMSVGAPDIKSAGSMTFGPDGILFIGDSQGAAVFAVDLDDTTKDSSSDKVDVIGLDKKLAAMLGTTPDNVFINDMAVNPISHNIYVSVSRGRGPDSMPVLMRVTKKGAIEEVPLSKVMFSKTVLSNPPKPDAKTEWGEPERPMTITHMVYSGGELFVAGLSSEEFSSSLRRFKFPFKDDPESTSLEIFHASHDRYETKAPIETFMTFHANGQPVLLAAYTCSPLAIFPIADLKQKKMLRGTTIAELGGGNRPLDMISFWQNGKEYVLISNSNRTLMRIDPADIDKAQPLTTGVKEDYQTAGVKYVSVAITGILQLDNLNDKYVVVINRDMETGALNLRSIQKDRL